MVRESVLRVAVVGSGVLGAAVADELVRRGLSVVICTAEESRLPVTDVAFGWLNAHGSAAEPPVVRDRGDLSRSRSALRSVTTPLRGLITWNGAVSWASTAAATARFAEQSGSGVVIVEAEALRQILPGLRVPPPVVAHASDEGMVEPDDLRRAFLSRARAGGATVVAAQVDRVRARRAGGYELRSTGVALVVDRVVLACGTGLPALAEQFGEHIEVPDVPAARFTFSAPELRLDRVVSTPAFEIRPSARHGFVGAEDVVPGALVDGEAGAGARVSECRERGVRTPPGAGAGERDHRPPPDPGRRWRAVRTAGECSRGRRTGRTSRGDARSLVGAACGGTTREPRMTWSACCQENAHHRTNHPLNPKASAPTSGRLPDYLVVINGWYW
ncbi:NAD(P)/FAD-dependent oxidoreductase [Kitasatospora sp. NPDC058032]|uniref:NAD(P)/FAD-dependent oxidoreductase n=1 Tax=Kitasatospora sp. NPDC058032 TaxID=3346307 RepID=UPI0036DC6894